MPERAAARARAHDRPARRRPAGRRLPLVAARRGTELAQIAPVRTRRRRPADRLERHRPHREPHVRVQLAERVLDTWLVLDTSPSMAFGTADRRKADVAEGVALAIGHVASAARQPARARDLRRAASRRRCRRGRAGRAARAAARARARSEVGAGTARRSWAKRWSASARDRAAARAGRRRLGLPRPARLAAAAAAPGRPPRRAGGRDPRPARGGARRRGRARGSSTRRPAASCASTRATAAAGALRARPPPRARGVESPRPRAARRRHVVLSTAGDWLRTLAVHLGGADELRLARRPARPAGRPPLIALVVAAERRRGAGAARFGTPALVAGRLRRRGRIRGGCCHSPSRSSRSARWSSGRRGRGRRSRAGEAGDGDPRSRLVPLDGGDRREAVAPRGRGRGSAFLPRRGARELLDRGRLLLDARVPRARADDGPECGEGGGRPDHARVRDGDRRAIERSVAAARPSQPGQPTRRTRSPPRSSSSRTASRRPATASPSPPRRARNSRGPDQHDCARHPGCGRRGPACQRRRRSGSPSSPDTKTLQQIARVTGGRFAAAPTAERLKQIYRDLGNRVGRKKETREVTAAFAGAGVVLMLFASGLSLAWSRRPL